ncbi:asparagine synthase-related protein, partial [Verrucomicrobiota bacterium]
PSLGYAQTALANLLSIYGYYAPKRHTIYEQVARLGVGQRLVFDAGRIELEELEFVPATVGEFDAADHDRYSELLVDSVRTRSSDACNWVFLSSGWDSTSILAILVHLHGAAGIRTVIGEMNYSERAGTINRFELDRARKVADYYGVRLDVVPFDLRGQDSIDYWKELAPEIRAQHVYAPAGYNFSRLADYVFEHGDPEDSVFAGEFSDAAHNLGFSQYATILEHPDLGFREYSDKMASYLFGPSFLARILAGDHGEDPVYRLLCDRHGAESFDDAAGLNEEQRRRKFLASFFLRNVRMPFYGMYASKLLTREGAEAIESEYGGEYLSAAAEELTPATVYSWLLQLYNSFYWQGSTRRAFSAPFVARGRTLSQPFADARVLKFLGEMPEDWGRGLELRPTKYPLKWMLENKLDYPLHLQTGPHSYLYDVNPQFSHSSELLFGSLVSSLFKQSLEGYPYEQVLQPEFFNLAYMRKLVDDYRSDEEFGGAARNDLMGLVMLCLIGWY